MIKTAVVILNWNGLNHIRQFMGTLVKYSSQPDVMIYLADNGSTDGSPEWVRNSFPEVRLTRFEKNNGFAGGYNKALAEIDAEYYLIINSDIEVTEGWIDHLTGYLDKNRDVAACQPKILSFHNRKSFEYAGAAGGFVDKFGYPFCRGRIFNFTEEDKGQYDNVVNVSWTSGACMAVRASAWKQCGGFDDDFFAHMEEIDLCWRFYRAGHLMAYVPSSVVFHVGGGTLPYTSPFKTYLNFRNSLFLLYKNLPDNKLKGFLFKRMILDGVAAAFFLLKLQISSAFAVLKAHIHYYRALPVLRTKRELVKKIAPYKPGFMMNKSMVFEFYVKGKKEFSALKNITPVTS